MSSQCRDDINETFDDAQVRKKLREIKEDIITLLKDLEYTYAINPNNQNLHVLKMKSSLANLDAIDNKLFYVYNALRLENEDDLESNFGVSLKLEMAKQKLNLLKEKHSNLNKEWHSQEKHLNKISENVGKKEKELKEQSIHCTIQGFTLSKMLWKFSKNTDLLEVIVSNAKSAVELVKIYSGCLYGFIHTFENQLPDPTSDEYQFVLCLTGTLNNFATIPDGRFFLLHQPVGRDILDQIVNTVPFITLPNGENLKFLTLSIIYNVMICEEGEEHMQNNPRLMHSLKNCIDLLNSDRIILLGLKIMNNLLRGHRCLMNLLDSPVKHLKTLDSCCTSSSVRKCAKETLTLLQKSDAVVKHVGAENIQSVKTKPKKEKICRKSFNGGENAAVTCYVVRNANASKNVFNCKTPTIASSLSTSIQTIHTSSSSLCSSSSVILLSRSFPTPKFKKIPYVGSEPTYQEKQKITPKRLRTVTISNDVSVYSDKSISCNLLDRLEDERRMLPANMNSVESQEIQTMQYQFPYTNLDKAFSITMGDNLQDPYINRLIIRKENYTEGEQINTSIMTLYRVRNSYLLTLPESSFFPFLSIPMNNTQTLTEAHSRCLRITQGLTNILDRDVCNTPTTSRKASSSVANKKICVPSDTSSNDDNNDQCKCKKVSKKLKKKKCAKSERPVFKIPFIGRKRL